jgi:hypothetical protein
VNWPPADYPHTNAFGRAYHAAEGKPWQPSRHPIAVVDLTLGEAGWRKHLRPSYKSLINWGRKNMTWETGHQLVPSVKAFHEYIAGRSTRPAETWRLMADEVEAERGDCIVGRYEGRIAAASVFIDGGTTSIYWTGVYDRDLFPKPISHYALWLGMERAAERGMTTLELGEAPYDGEASEKEYAIGYFKRGFATYIVAPERMLLTA